MYIKIHHNYISLMDYLVFVTLLSSLEFSLLSVLSRSTADNPMF